MVASASSVCGSAMVGEASDPTAGDGGAEVEAEAERGLLPARRLGAALVSQRLHTLTGVVCPRCGKSLYLAAQPPHTARPHARQWWRLCNTWKGVWQSWQKRSPCSSQVRLAAAGGALGSSMTQP